MASGSPHECGEVGVDSAFSFIMRSIFPNAFNEVVPFILPGAEFVFGWFPNDVVSVDPHVFKEVDRSGMDSTGELGRAFGTVDVGGEFGFCLAHAAETAECLAAVWESILDGVDIEVLTTVGTIGNSSSKAMGLHRPGI